MSAGAKRADQLRAELREHNERYYVQDDPSIGDDQYDALLDELRELERDNPELVTADSPTQRVGAEPVSALEKVTHPQAMFSLANARSPEEFDAWVLRMRNHLAREGIDDAAFQSGKMKLIALFCVLHILLPVFLWFDLSGSLFMGGPSPAVLAAMRLLFSSHIYVIPACWSSLIFLDWFTGHRHQVRAALGKRPFLFLVSHVTRARCNS